MTPLLFIAGQRMSSLPQQSGRHFCLLLYNPFVHSSFPTESARFAKSTPGIRMKSESSRKRDYSVAYGATDHFFEAQGGKYQTLA